MPKFMALEIVFRENQGNLKSEWTNFVNNNLLYVFSCDVVENGLCHPLWWQCEVNVQAYTMNRETSLVLGIDEDGLNVRVPVYPVVDLGSIPGQVVIFIS